MMDDDDPYKKQKIAMFASCLKNRLERNAVRARRKADAASEYVGELEQHLSSDHFRRVTEAHVRSISEEVRAAVAGGAELLTIVERIRDMAEELSYDMDEILRSDRVLGGAREDAEETERKAREALSALCASMRRRGGKELLI